MNVVPVLIDHARDPERGQKGKFKDAFSGGKRGKGNCCAAEQMIIFRNHGFNVVATRSEQTLVFLRARGLALQFRYQMLGIPDAVVHSAAIAIDKRNFLW